MVLVLSITAPRTTLDALATTGEGEVDDGGTPTSRLWSEHRGHDVEVSEASLEDAFVTLTGHPSTLGTRDRL
jgi:hypothetical protein